MTRGHGKTFTNTKKNVRGQEIRAHFTAFIGHSEAKQLQVCGKDLCGIKNGMNCIIRRV